MNIPYEQLEARGIKDPKVLVAIRNLPRELFVSVELQEAAYFDAALPIACGQTISQPYIVAFMTEKLELKATDKVLEIGTGSGFQTGVLTQLVREVYTVEIYKELTAQASQILNMLGYKNVKYKVGDGKLGWKEFAPFDAIIITAANKEIPPRLLQQLKTGGRLILPLKTNLDEYLYLVNKNLNDELEYTQLCGVRFVPLL